MDAKIGSLTQCLLIAVAFICIIDVKCGSKDFQREVLDEHNKHRGTHNASPLLLDDKLTKNATLTAKKAAESGNFESISPGQSVFVSCATFKRAVTGKEVTEAWYGEVCNPDFDFHQPDNEKARGFTQLIWKDTVKLGVGKATGKGKDGEICVYIVGVYRPPGNLVGFFEENVDAGTFDKKEFCATDDDDVDDAEQKDNEKQVAQSKEEGYEGQGRKVGQDEPGEKEEESEEEDEEENDVVKEVKVKAEKKTKGGSKKIEKKKSNKKQ